MTQYLTLIFILLSGLATGQELAFNVELLDVEKSPVKTNDLEDIFSTPNGAFLLHLNNEERIVSFFNQDSVVELFRFVEPLDFVGATEEGVYMLKGEESSPQDLLFLDVNGNLETLTDGPVELQFVHQLGESILVFGESVGVRRYTKGEAVIILREEYLGCLCSDRFFEFNGQLVFPTRHHTAVTDGTIEGTITLSSNTGGTSVSVNDKLLFFWPGGILLSYDPVTKAIVNLSTEHPNFTDDFYWLGHYVVTEQGFLFVAETNDSGKELYITDGSPESTRLLLELNPGEEDGVNLLEGSPVVVDGHLLFYGGANINNPHLWISDGTVEGTNQIFGVIQHPGTENSFEGDIVNNKLMLLQGTAHQTFNDPDYIYVYDFEEPELGLVPIDTLHYNILRATKYVLDDHIVFRRRVDDLDGDLLYSYGINPGSLHILKELAYADEVNSISPNHLMVNFKGDYLAPDTLLFYQGGEDRITSSLPVYSQSSQLRTPVWAFETDRGPYVYSFSEQHGEAIHALDLQTSSVSLKVDLFQNNDGLYGVPSRILGDKILFHFDDEHPSAPLQLLSTTDLRTDTLVFEGDAQWSFGLSLLGGTGDKFYFKNVWGNSFDLLEIDLESKIVKKLNHLFPDESFDNYSTLLWLNGKIYHQGFNHLHTPERRTASLFEIDPITEETRILTADTMSFFNSILNTSMATDGEHLYFSKKFADGVRPAAYDPVSGLIVPVGPFQELSGYVFKQIGEKMYVDYSAPFDPGSYPVSINGLGNRMEVHFTSSHSEPIALEDYILSVFTARGLLVSIDKLTGDTTGLLEMGLETYRDITPISNKEAIFMARLHDSQPWAIWRTDGTPSGTRRVMFLPIPEGYYGPSASAFGSYVTLVLGGDNHLFIFDPSTETLQLVDPLQQATARKGVINNALYYTAYDSLFGIEMHRLRITPPDYISDTVFYDLNMNGAKDDDEPGIPNARIMSSGERSQVVYTNREGVYKLPVKDGTTYTLEILPATCYNTLTTPQSYQISYSQDSSYSLPFGYAALNGNAELRALLNSGTIRCGFEHDFWLTILNDGCLPLAGEGSVTFPEEMAFIESDEAPLSNENNTLIFAFDTLQPGSSQRYRIRFRLPDENFAGLPIDLAAAAGAMDVDGAMIESDTFAYSEILRCAIDPNDKQVSPSRTEPSNSNYTQIDETIRYTIRFQNTGNDTAFTVRIEDQISESLNLETLKPLAASHPYSVAVRNDRTLVFLFEDILLPDSTTNLPGSQGFVTFEINAHPGLEDFSSIDNTAGIYFDFNQPVITNTVASTFVEFLDEDQDGFLFYEECNDRNFDINPNAAEIPNNGIDENCDDLDDFPVSSTQALQGTLRCFPSPTSGLLALTYTDNTPLNGELYSASGVRIRKFSFQKTLSLNLSALPAGLYLIRLYSPEEGRGAVIRVVRE
jgi:uncharacterized repeat protein (TIGR01451 family)